MTKISILLKMNSSAKKSFKERMNNENSLLKYFSVSMGYTKYVAYFDLISPLQKYTVEHLNLLGVDF